MSKKDKISLDEFIKRIEFVQQNTGADFNFLNEDKESRIKRAKTDYNYFVKTYFPHLAGCDCGDFQIKAANKIKRESRIKAVLKWFRGGAKSTHSNIFIPIWLWLNKEMRFMVLIGPEQTMAKKLLSEIQAEFEGNNLLKHDFGDMVLQGSWAEGDFALNDETCFVARGRGQKLRGLKYKGHRPDYVVMDDIDDDEMCENPERVKKLIKWINKAVMFIGDIGRFRVVISNNLISQISVTAHFSKQKDWWCNQVDAIDGNGDPTWHEKYTREYYEELRMADEISFQSEMMHNPQPEGEIFKSAETQYIKMNWATMRNCTSVVAKWDVAFTKNKNSDYNAVSVVGFKPNKLLVFKAYCRQSLMSEVLEWMYSVDKEAKKHNVVIEWFAERQFWNEPVKDAVELAAKQHGYYLEIVMDDTSQQNKIKRIIKGLASYWQTGKLWFNEYEKESYDMKTGLGQLWAVDYSYSGKDDFPDSLEATVAKGKRMLIADGIDYTIGQNKKTNGLI
jgi:hypothetical protein